jgi:hypothetical protein
MPWKKCGFTLEERRLYNCSDETYNIIFYSRQFSTYLPVVIGGVRIIKSKKAEKHIEYCVPKRCLKKLGEKNPSYFGAILILFTGGDPYCKWINRKELQEILPVINVESCIIVE